MTSRTQPFIGRDGQRFAGRQRVVTKRVGPGVVYNRLFRNALDHVCASIDGQFFRFCTRSVPNREFLHFDCCLLLQLRRILSVELLGDLRRGVPQHPLNGFDGSTARHQQRGERMPGIVDSGRGCTDGLDDGFPVPLHKIGTPHQSAPRVEEREIGIGESFGPLLLPMLFMLFQSFYCDR